MGLANPIFPIGRHISTANSSGPGHYPPVLPPAMDAKAAAAGGHATSLALTKHPFSPGYYHHQAASASIDDGLSHSSADTSASNAKKLPAAAAPALLSSSFPMSISFPKISDWDPSVRKTHGWKMS